MTASRITVWILRITPASLIAAVALWTLSLQRAEMSQDPTPLEWAQAQHIVREGFVEGDIVRTAPYWADQARSGMYEIPFNPTAEIEDEELFLYDRLWIIADAEHVDGAIEALPVGYEVLERWAPNPRSAVLLVDIPDRERVLLDTVSQLDQAQVYRDYGDRQELCDNFHRGGWHCGRVDPWLHVTPTVDEVGGSLHRCIYVGLPPDAELRVVWSAVELGGRVEGNVGNTMPAIRAERGSDIDFRVEVDGQSHLDLTFDKWDQSFLPFSFETNDLAGSTHELAFVMHAADFYDRWICFRARVLR